VLGQKREELAEGRRKLHDGVFHNVLVTKYYQNNETEDEMGDTCSMQWRSEKCLEKLSRLA